MRGEAEEHAEEDKKQRELAELRNQADSMCWQLEKLLKEQEAKLKEADKEAITKSIEKTREAAKGDNAESIKSALSELEQASHALSKSLYESAGAQAGAAAGAAADSAPKDGGDSAGDDDAIDAEFEVKDS